jgi:fructoselysine-6-P-deglycase FrlB-like protein
MGTSEYVPALITRRLAARGIAASVADAGELLHYPMPVPGLLVLVSQSGESVEPLKIARRHGDRDRLCAVVNNERSTIANAASLVLPMCAGAETSITTKTYANTMAVMHLMAQAVEGEGNLECEFERLEAVAVALAQPDPVNDIESAARLLADATNLHVIARGPAMVAARQAALTFMEGARISCTAFTGGAFRHGPMETVDAQHRCVVYLPGGTTFGLVEGMARELARLGSHVVIITDQDVTLEDSDTQVLRVPEFGEDLFPLAAAKVQALLLDAMAQQRGLVAGEFRLGSKVTSRE